MHKLKEAVIRKSALSLFITALAVLLLALVPNTTNGPVLLAQGYGYGGGGGASTPPAGTTYTYDSVTSGGEFTKDVTVESDDREVELTVAEGTVGLTEDGERLLKIDVKKMSDPPDPPEESQRIGFNSRMNELTAAIGLEGLEQFEATFNKRKDNLYKLLELTRDLADYCYFMREEDYEKVSPHAFPIVLKDKKYDCARLYNYLESKGIQCKTLFGSLPTQHQAFKFLGYQYGQFPASEYVGENGLHFGIHQYLSEDDLVYISDALKEHFISER